jgi:hypothetical protein
MGQLVSVLMVGCVLVGALVGMKVGRARSSHSYYRRAAASMPAYKRTAWSDIRAAAGFVLLAAILVAAFVVGISAQG